MQLVLVFQCIEARRGPASAGCGILRARHNRRPSRSHESSAGIAPHGKQGGLKPVQLRGAISVDPTREDFFTRVIEYRKQNKANDRLQHFLKILANSTSHGTYLELNPVKTDPSNRPKIAVYSGEHIFEQPAPDTIEQCGSFYFPLLGALITSGGRLLRCGSRIDERTGRCVRALLDHEREFRVVNQRCRPRGESPGNCKRIVTSRGSRLWRYTRTSTTASGQCDSQAEQQDQRKHGG